MAKSLPHASFEWEENSPFEKLDEQNFFNVSDDAYIGYILKVDSEYTEH